MFSVSSTSSSSVVPFCVFPAHSLQFVAHSILHIVLVDFVSILVMICFALAFRSTTVHLYSRRAWQDARPSYIVVAVIVIFIFVAAVSVVAAATAVASSARNFQGLSAQSLGLDQAARLVAAWRTVTLMISLAWPARPRRSPPGRRQRRQIVGLE